METFSIYLKAIFGTLSVHPKGTTLYYLDIIARIIVIIFLILFIFYLLEKKRKKQPKK